MRRQRRMQQSDDMDTDEYHPANITYQQMFRGNNEVDDILQMDRLTRGSSAAQSQAHRFENTIEAKVEVGDTLQALALRFHCTVADIKRLNKIDKENEIHARKVVKIPVTVHSVLLETLPTVHKSGNNSPKCSSQGERDETESNIMRNPLEDARVALSEKLMVASVNASGVNAKMNSTASGSGNGINNTILHSRIGGRAATNTDAVTHHNAATMHDTDTSPLLTDILDDDEIVSRLRPIRGPSLSALQWSGSDCDMTWVCLFVVTLALCFAIPLIVVIFYMHPHSTASH